MSGAEALADIVRVAIRWAHAVAAIAWVGGAVFYLAVLRPALRGVPDAPRLELERVIAGYFRELVEIGIVVLVVSGAILTVDRLSSGLVGTAYVAVLALKVAVSVVMFWLAWELGRWGRRAAGVPRPTRPSVPARRWPRPSRLMPVLGLVVVLLAIVLRALYERALRGPV